MTAKKDLRRHRVSGLAAAIRMHNKGYKVTVYEANSFPGGKCSSEEQDGYRFDMALSIHRAPPGG